MEGKKQGYAVEFVHNPPKELQTTCSVCRKVLSQPKMVDCCGVRFCAACLTVQGEYSYGRPLCPQCGQPFNSMPDKQLERTLNDFDVRCIHRKKGCWWTGNLGSLSEHLMKVLNQKGTYLMAAHISQLSVLAASHPASDP